MIKQDRTIKILTHNNVGCYNGNMRSEDVTKEGNSKYISVKEAADIMGYSRIHIVRLINSGQIEARKVGRAFVVDRNSIRGIYKSITAKEKTQIDKAVTKIMDEYGEAIKKLGKE